VPVPRTPWLTARKQEKYDWKSMMEIRKGDDHELADAAGLDLEETVGGHTESTAEFEEEQRKLKRAGTISKSMTVILVRYSSPHLADVRILTTWQTLAFLILWPMPMYGTGYIFSKKFFTGWVTVGIIWIFCSFFAVGLFPVFEGRHTLVRTFKNIYLDVTGKQHPKTIHGQEPVVSTSGGDVTPTEKGADEKTTVKED
jgi:hypothetical protein